MLAHSRTPLWAWQLARFYEHPPGGYAAVAMPVNYLLQSPAPGEVTEVLSLQRPRWATHARVIYTSCSRLRRAENHRIIPFSKLCCQLALIQQQRPQRCSEPLLLLREPAAWLADCARLSDFPALPGLLLHSPPGGCAIIQGLSISQVLSPTSELFLLASCM